MAWINIKIWTISTKFHYPYEWIFGKATPPEYTTESVAGQTMNIPAWDSTIEITQASIDNLWLYAKYKATA
jgi:hypothetical protein